MRGRRTVLWCAWTTFLAACSREVPESSGSRAADAERSTPRFQCRLELPTLGQPTAVRVLDLGPEGRPALVAVTRGMPGPEGGRGSLHVWPDPLRHPREVRIVELPDYLLGPEPCTFSDGERLVLASQATRELCWIDPRAEDVAGTLGRLALDSAPRALAAGMLRGAPTVACATARELWVLAPAGGRPLARVPLPLDDPVATFVRIEPDGILVGSQAAECVFRWAADDAGALAATPERIDVGGIPRASLPRSDGLWLAVGDRDLVRLGSDGVERARQVVGSIPLALAPDPSDAERLVALTYYDLAYHVLRAGAREHRGYAGQDARDVVWGDLDGDGLPELAVANRGAQRVSLWRGGPDGPIEATLVATPGGPSRMAIGDVDGDGTRETVVFCPLDDAAVLVGADGEVRARLSPGEGADRPVLADLDGDGALELCFLRARGKGTDVVVWPRTADGAGWDRARERTLAAGAPAADLTAVPHAAGARVIVALPTKSALLEVRLAGEALEEVGRTTLEGAPAPPELVCTLDGGLAVALGTSGARRGLVMLARDGDTGWREESALELVIAPLDLLTLESDGDGSRELALLAEGPQGRDGSGRLIVVARDAAGQWQVRHQTATGMRPFAAAAGDLDGDGRDDLVVGAQNNHHVNVFLSTERGLQRLPDLGVGRGTLGVAVQDLDGDGRAEVLAADAFSNDLAIVRRDG